MIQSRAVDEFISKMQPYTFDCALPPWKKQLWVWKRHLFRSLHRLRCRFCTFEEINVA